MSNRKNSPTPFGAAILGMLDTARVPHYRFYEAIGIGKSYFYQILNELPPAPDVVERMIDTIDTILPPDPQRRAFILEQAAKTRNQIPPDIYDMIRSHPEKWNKLRKYLKKQF